MTQSELISLFPDTNSIAERVLLVKPAQMRQLAGCSVEECRVFLLITEGAATLKIDSNEIEVGENVLVDMLVWKPVTFVRLSDNLRAWCLMPNYLFTNESLNGMKPADSESFKDRHEVPMMPLDKEETATLVRQLELLEHSLADVDNFYRPELCRTYFRSFMLECGNLVQHKKKNTEETLRVETRQDMIIRSFLKLVWRYYKSEHNVEFYARQLNLSAKHLSRVVKERLGNTPYAVIRDEVLQQATEMLKLSKKSVQDIAIELHFSEMPAFCKFFKKHTGMSPTDYRRQHSL